MRPRLKGTPMFYALAFYAVVFAAAYAAMHYAGKDC